MSAEAREIAPDGHDCTWRFAEIRKDSNGVEWVRDECAHGWSGEWFPRDLNDPGYPAPWRASGVVTPTEGTSAGA